MGTDILRYGDAAMFDATPMLKEEGARVTPRVFLLSATPDPLGAIAAGFRMYAGEPTYSLSDITDDERIKYWEESLVTHLKAPWEFVDLHFFIEGVTRAFTHQQVRQRTAVYAQESLRFAVKHGIASEAAMPPSIVNAEEGVGKIWQDTLEAIEVAYEQLVNAGIPAEDARGLLPHCVTTRLNYKTNFRNLVETMGVRLCTQAQFEWRSVALGIVRAIQKYQPMPGQYSGRLRDLEDPRFPGSRNQWQFQILGSPIAETFTPVCYKAGHCTFMGKLDRGCTIRERVNKFSENGVPSSQWGEAHTFNQTDGGGVTYPVMWPGIRPEEWAANPWAGITNTDADRPQGSAES